MSDYYQEVIEREEQSVKMMREGLAKTSNLVEYIEQSLTKLSIEFDRMEQILLPIHKPIGNVVSSEECIKVT